MPPNGRALIFALKSGSGGSAHVASGGIGFGGQAISRSSLWAALGRYLVARAFTGLARNPIYAVFARICFINPLAGENCELLPDDPVVSALSDDTALKMIMVLVPLRLPCGIGVRSNELRPGSSGGSPFTTSSGTERGAEAY